MARVLRMPGSASDAHDGVLSSWLIDETDTFDAAQTIAYVETSTVVLSVEAGRPGVLLKTLVEPGAHIDVGTPIGLISDGDEEVLDVDGLLAELGVEEPPPSSHRAEPSVETTEPELARVGHGPFRVKVRAERLVALMPQGLPSWSVEDLVAAAVHGAHAQFPAMNVTRRPDGVRREGTVEVGPEGSIVLTTLGRHSLDEVVPHVVAPQTAALALGGIRDEPVVEGATVVPGKTLSLTLATDAEAIDDATATRWLGVLAALLERPEWMYD